MKHIEMNQSCHVRTLLLNANLSQASLAFISTHIFRMLQQKYLRVNKVSMNDGVH